MNIAGWVRLARYARPRIGDVGLSIPLVLAGVALETLKPWPMKLLADHVLTSRPLPPGAGWLATLPGGASAGGLLAWLAVSTVLLYGLVEIVRIVQAYVQAGMTGRMVVDLADTLFRHVQQLSLRYHGQHATGDLVRRVTTDSACIRTLVNSAALPVLTSVLSLVAMLSVMWHLDPRLSLVAIAVAGPMALAIRLSAGPMAARAYEQENLQGQMVTFAERTLSAMPVVQAFVREDHEDRRFRDLSERNMGAYVRTIASQLRFKVSTSAVTTAGTAMVMVIGGLAVLEGRLSLGGLLVFLSYLPALYAPLETLAYVSTGVTSAAASARRVLEILDAEDSVQDAPHAVPLVHRPRGHVRFVDVTFGYEPDRPVLHDVSLEARPGETLALVGPSGAGKSTLVSLIPRLFDPWQGHLLLDDVDLRTLQLRSLRTHVALVLQDPFLLPLSVADNIAYGRPGASHADIVHAARAANADDFIRRLPQGYDTVIGERGATLSGGEKQRLAIARALLKDAPVLILDEPTAALDAQTEALLLEALDRLAQGRTTFVIAHRLSTIRRADRIAVLDHGRLVELGTHQALLEAQGPYRRLHALATQGMHAAR